MTPHDQLPALAHLEDRITTLLNRRRWAQAIKLASDCRAIVDYSTLTVTIPVRVP